MKQAVSNLMKRINRNRARFFLGFGLIAIFCSQFPLSAGPNASIDRQAPIIRETEMANADSFEALIRHDPLKALIEARTQHLRAVIDYECVMVKQELLPDGMSKEQEIKVKFRHAPYSVYMEWQRNPGLAARVLYVKGRWNDATATDPAERELAIAQPGAIARIFVKSVKEPIHGCRARRVSRRFIDDFGFQKTLDRLIGVSELARSNGELTIDFIGETQFDGRPVWVVRRILPFKGEGGVYPDRIAEILVDKEFRVPVAIYCYSNEDRQPRNLIAKYEYRSVRMQVGLTDQDFEPLTYGM